eukprot:483696-Rhodomonas_salina.1
MTRMGQLRAAVLILSAVDLVLAFSTSFSKLPHLASRRAPAVSQSGARPLTMMAATKKKEPPAVPDHLKGKKLLGLGIGEGVYVCVGVCLCVRAFVRACPCLSGWGRERYAGDLLVW